MRKWKEFYQIIKGQDWPECKTFRDIPKLPEAIQKELFEKYNVERFILAQPERKAKKFNNIQVTDRMIPYLESAKYIIKLQDLVNSNGEILVDVLGIPPINDKQRSLLSKWRSLHTPKLLDQIGISKNG
jgi:hypothetical protein